MLGYRKDRLLMPMGCWKHCERIATTSIASDLVNAFKRDTASLGRGGAQRADFFVPGIGIKPPAVLFGLRAADPPEDAAPHP
jgi:hypothetical protein